MPDKRRLVTSKVCFGSEKAGLLDHSYNKCALVINNEKRFRIAKNMHCIRHFQFNKAFEASESSKYFVVMNEMTIGISGMYSAI